MIKLIVPIKVKGVLYKVGDEVPEKVFKLYPSLKKFKDDKGKKSSSKGKNTDSSSNNDSSSSGGSKGAEKGG